MSGMIGPHGVSGWRLTLAFVTLLSLTLSRGIELTPAMGWSATATAVVGVMASWGLGRCRFAENMTARSDAADAEQSSRWPR